MSILLILVLKIVSKVEMLKTSCISAVRASVVIYKALIL